MNELTYPPNSNTNNT